MTWEQLPRRSSSRRWAAVTVAVAGVALVVVAVAGRDGLGARSAETIPVGRNLTAPPEGAASDDAVDPASFEPRRLPPPVQWTRPRIGANILPGADPGLTIIATDHLGVWTADTASGWVQRLRLPQGATPAMAGGLWASDGGIVFNTSATVLRLSDTRRLHTFATAHRMIDTVDTDAVWVFHGAGRSSGGIASRVSLGGEVLDQVRVPAVATPFVGTDAQLLVTAAGTVISIGADGSRALIARGEAVASNGVQLAWVQCSGGLSCDVVLGTVDAPDGVRMPLEPGRRPLTRVSGGPVAAFSPDGRWLALPFLDASPTGERATITIALIDAVTGVEIHRVEGSRTHPFESPLAWSPDSRWLIFASDSGIDAWRAGSRETTTLDLGFSVARDLAVRSVVR